MSLVRIVQLRDAVDQLCEAIDAGRVVVGRDVTEMQMFKAAEIVAREAGPLAHDLCCKLASRTKSGTAALKDVAQ